MKEVLEPLAAIPGVRAALLATPDGVPIVSCGNVDSQGGAGADALAGLVSGWCSSLVPTLGAASWEFGQRAVLRGSRGTLVVRCAGHVLLFAVLEPGASVEDLRIPLDAALSRLARVSRGSRAPQPALPRRIPQAEGAAPSDTSSATSPRDSFR